MIPSVLCSVSALIHTTNIRPNAIHTQQGPLGCYVAPFQWTVQMKARFPFLFSPFAVGEAVPCIERRLGGVGSKWLMAIEECVYSRLC